MSDALFLRDGDLFIPTELSGGPWSSKHLHGGPPTGLLAQVMEAAADSSAMRLSRLTVDLLRPVPRAPLRVSVKMVRAGRRLQLLAGSIFADDVEVCRASALYLERSEVEVPEYGQFKDAPMPARDESSILTLADLSGSKRKPGSLTGLHTTADACLVDGAGGRGKGRAWMRLPVPVIAGETSSNTVQIATLADFGNGVGQLRLNENTGSINSDITLYLHRVPVGPWLGLDSRSRMEPNGTGLSETTLHDDRGPIGLVVQATLVMPWRNS